MTGMFTKKNNFKKGFTLIELIVVTAVFLFIIGVAIGVFISIIQNQRNVLSEQQFLNQISYAEEYMSKAMRMASTEEDENCLVDYSPGSDQSSHPGYIYLLTRYDSSLQTFKGIKFINQTGDSSGNPVCQEFYLDNSDPNNLVLMEVKGTADPVPITSAGRTGLKIESIKFSINGSDGTAASPICHGDFPNDCGAANTDFFQPKVTILLNVKTSTDGQAPVRTIQTTVSQRNLNAK